MQSHTAQPALDYNSMITGQISNPNMHQKHGEWVKEVKPWSRTLLKVDDLDEANEQHGIGLARYKLQSVDTVNPLHVIEGSELGANNKTFRFQG
jgi:hypothetical protein